jgi:hypothetical protein
MELKNKKTVLELNQGEEIVYFAEKTKFDYYCHVILFSIIAVFVCFLLLRLIAIYNILFDIKGSWIYLIVVIGLYSVYKRIKDYFFTDFILTNQRILIIKSEKLTSLDFAQIDYAFAIRHILRPDVVKIRLKNQKLYLTDFVNEKELNNQIKSLSPAIKNKK